MSCKCFQKDPSGPGFLKEQLLGKNPVLTDDAGKRFVNKAHRHASWNFSTLLCRGYKGRIKDVETGRCALS